MNWKKHVRTGLNLFMGTMAGVFLGSSLYTCWEWVARPGLYAMMSVPWYTSILLHALVTAVCIGLALVVRRALR